MPKWKGREKAYHKEYMRMRRLSETTYDLLDRTVESLSNELNETIKVCDNLHKNFKELGIEIE